MGLTLRNDYAWLAVEHYVENCDILLCMYVEKRFHYVD